MSKSSTRRAKPRAKSPETSKPAATAKPSRAAASAPREEDADDAELLARGGALCRSCGKRPGRPTAILGQMTQAELCPQCTALRKERIRLNRAAARGHRSSRLF